MGNKNSMKDTDFIKSLSKDLEPIKRLPASWKRFLTWSVLYLIPIVSIMWLIKPLPSFANLDFESVLLLVSFVATGLLAFALLIPGFNLSKLQFSFGILPMLLFFLTVTYRYFFPETVIVSNDLLSNNLASKNMNIGNMRSLCELEIIIYSAGALGVFWLFAKQSAPIYIKKLALLSAVSATSLSIFFMQSACSTTAMHTLLFHSPPIILAIVFNLFILPKSLKW